MTRTIIASLYEHEALNSIINELTSSGIRHEDIGVAAKNPQTIPGMSSQFINSSFSSDQLPIILGDMDLNDEEIKYYRGQLDNNALLLFVNARNESDIPRIERILSERGLAVTETESTAGKRATSRAATKDRKGEVVLPVTEEEMQVGKRTVQRGGVRVHQRVTEKPIHDSIRLREEHIRVERRPVDRPLTQEESGRIKEQSFEMREQAEEPLVSKQARVVEEVVVRKDVTERDQEVTGKVRRSDVDVQQTRGSEPSAGRQAGGEVLESGTTIPSQLQRIDQASYFEIGGGKHNPKGWKVVGPDDEKLGEIEYLLGNPADRKAYLAVIDCGGFFSNKHVAVPISQMRFRPEEETVYVPYDKDQLKQSPDFHSSTTDFQQYFDYWRNAGTREDMMATKSE